MNKRIASFGQNNKWHIVAIIIAICAICLALRSKDIQDYFRKNIWDFIAIVIAFCSFCVALRSYFIAKKTLKSQRQTEINTTPLMNKDVQSFLMKENLFQLYDAYINLNALKNVLDECDYGSFPYRGIQQDLEINSDFIHLEIFFTQVTTYHAFKGFTDLIRNYNSGINCFFDSIRNKELTKDYYSKMLEDFIKSVNDMVHYWIIIMKKCYSLNENNLSEIMDNIIGLFKYNLEDPRISKIINKESNFIEFYSEEEKQEELIAIMNFRLKDAVDEYSKLLINYERIDK